ncbi:DUF2909 family protein [Shewanella gelidii]|uniref:DUF2909 domain-containing protein n=1 Tax=Shewanella gelidii TaxID=1642821 RepID=A0A917JQR7_9GAMM|nr:DUF2909 family protein [Shewanella gelidii]MCL1099099.1 DUF2909 domain-containing protein [Shewanella gelidii]GGI81836.1 hypothetical protein GCM10009332_18870 [Shewanella gelidii]
MNSLVVFKVLLVLLLLFIVMSLGRALFILVKGESKQPMTHFLGRRVLLSALVILLLLLALAFGLISPNPRPY